MPDKTASICLVCDNAHRLAQALQFSSLNALPLNPAKSSEYTLHLVFGDEILELHDTRLNTSIAVDFVNGTLAHRQQHGGGRGQAMAKAIGLKRGNTPSVLDVTAGLARDAYVLACLGCSITLIEQSPILAALLRDGIERGLLAEASAAVLTANFELFNMNAIEYMKNITGKNRPDVIYIDPMYPERNKSALVKKDMQILHHLLGEDENAEALLEAALASTTKRVVIKRPIHAEAVGGHKPTTSINSKKTRYDVYLNR